MTPSTSSGRRPPARPCSPVADVDADAVPYFSIVIVPGAGRRGGELSAVGRESDMSAVHGADRRPTVGPAELLVVGLGPGPDEWITPEVTAALAAVDHVVGYAPYVNRVPQREGLQRHASGNTVEVDRAGFALDLALRGERVAVVSGGDAGVFGMASAVYEAAAGPALRGRARSGCCPGSARCRRSRPGSARRSAGTSR